VSTNTPNPQSDNTIHEVPVGSLTEYPGNPRVGDINSLAESLTVNGQYRPIIVNRQTTEILAGNHTWKAAKQLGWDTIKVIYVDNVTEEQAKRIVLADNRQSDLASYDEGALAELLKGLPDLVGTGYSSEYLKDLLTEVGEDSFFSPSASSDREAPDEFGAFDEEAATDYCCPKCGYEWSGGAK
jgi:hypothetical protein